MLQVRGFPSYLINAVSNVYLNIKIINKTDFPETDMTPETNIKGTFFHSFCKTFVSLISSKTDRRKFTDIL
jgi:hypothetical protein